jgi:hypothetical protein
MFWRRRGRSLGERVDSAGIAVKETCDGYLGIPFASVKKRDCCRQILICYGSELLERKLLFF